MVASLLDELAQASGLRVKAGWPAKNYIFPLITLSMQSSSIRPVDQSGQKLLYELSFQLDVWQRTPKARDETFDRIVAHLAASRERLARDYGWFGIALAGIADVEEEGVFRKIATLSLRMLG